MEKKKYSNNIVTRDVKICPMTGGRNIGAMISLSFKDAEYIRVEFLEDKITFIPTSKIADDGCFYTKYVNSQARIFLPRTFLNYYRTVEGYELMGRTVPRLIVDGGYGIKVKRIKEFTLNDFGISFAKEEMPSIEGFFERSVANYSTRKSALSKLVTDFKSTPYYIVDVFYGEKAGVIITPSENQPKGLPAKNELNDLLGSHLQHFCGTHIKYYTSNKMALAPSSWFKTFTDYKNRTFSISANPKSERFLVQMKDECIVDGKEIHSAEFNSGERYICSDCQNVAKEQDEELLSLVKGLIESYGKMKAMYEAASKDVALYKAKAEMLDEAMDTSGMSSISMKLHRMKMAEKEARIAELEAKNKALEPEVEFIDLNDII